MKAETPFDPFRASAASVRIIAMTTPACVPLVTHALVPLTTHSFPSRRA